MLETWELRDGAAIFEKRGVLLAERYFAIKQRRYSISWDD